MFFSSYGFAIFCLVSAVLGLPQPVPYDPSPFDIVGAINSMTLDPTGGTLAGGSIVVDGLSITVPANLLVTLPAITVAWGELFSGGASSIPAGYQAHVIGNRVKDAYIAGLVYIAQNPLEKTEGFITSINIATGHFKIGGAADGSGGLDCVINDPTGRFGLPYTANPLFTADPDNPSIHAKNGFPMCIPRTTTDDPLCPSRNRPLGASGAPQTSFTFPDPATIPAGDTTTPDARIMAPLMVGDFVTVTGTVVGGGLLEANNLVANLAIFTAAGKDPAYITVEEAIWGIVTTQAGEIAETRATAWSTDLGTSIAWLAQDIDPCTGNIAERQIALAGTNNVATVPQGRVRYRLSKIPISNPTRQVVFRLQRPTTVTTNNITAGQFVQPIFDYVFPELTAIGSPMLTNSFEVIPFLALGSGPYVPGKPGAAPPTTPVSVGQLNPFPNVPAPAATSCPPPPTGAPPPAPSPAATTPPAATPSPGPVPDTVKITSATGRNGRGVTTVVVTATTNNPGASLTVSLAGQNPINNVPMVISGPPSPDGTTTWSVTIQVKSKPNTATVNSDKGGSATAPVV